MLALVFGWTLFASASLLFVIQPIVGRMLLPLLGGSPTVWNTCMVFFQGVLLLGYLYAHLSLRWLGLRRQIGLHMILLAIPLLFLPLAIPKETSPNIEAPVLSLLGTLLIYIAVPFFVVSTTAPLLQRWFSSTGHRSAQDPYFLYTASNLGSLLALLAYPVVIEPFLPLSQQSDWWQWGYLIFCGSVLLCGLWTLLSQPDFKASRVASDVLSPGANATRLASDAVSPGANATRLSWLILGLIPSSFLLAVTSYITTDIAPIPLLWVIPLALYLLTFILAFSQTIRLPLKFLGRMTAICIVAQTLAMLTRATEPIWILLPLHLLTFFLGSLICHGWVARLRPRAEELTRFYLYLSLGGVLGGIFNTFLAPILFQKLGLVEYPLLLVVIAAIRPEEGFRFRLLDLILPLIVAGFVVAEMMVVQRNETITRWLQSTSESSGLKVDQIRSALLFGLPLIVVYCFIDRPIRFALGLGGLFFVGSFDPGPWGQTIYLERHSLGIIRVTRDSEEKFHRMIHGNTIHGIQRLGSNEPLSFYSRTGPAGKVFDKIVDHWEGDRKIGVVGLGTGSLASYAKPTQDWLFFELDPTVEKIARDERFFTFLKECQAKSWDVLLGDARLKLQQLPDATFDLLVFDAFSSDAIPIHLLTLEAMELYFQKLKPGGLLLFHISNRSLNLAPILEKLSQTLEEPCLTLLLDNTDVDPTEGTGKSPSVWFAMSRNEANLRPLTGKFMNLVPTVQPGIPLWTDDRVNIWPVWKVRREED